jgi:parallel beta-helix repeat protein
MRVFVMNKKIIAVAIALVLVGGIAVGVTLLLGGMPGVSIGEPVVITSNTDFDDLGYSGNGTEENPYIIENLRISPNILDDTNCITIEDTTMFFIIRSCVLSTSRDARCISLSNVQNAVIEDCTVSGGDYGIFVYDSNNVNITGNQISSCDFGLGIFQSTNYNQVDNTYTDCVTDDVIQD